VRGSSTLRVWGTLRAPRTCQASVSVQSPLLVQATHLADADIRSYVAGTVNPQTERHMRLCVCCALRLADAAQRAIWWERRGLLGCLVRVENSQAVEELLVEIAREQRRDAA
jgi:hypothetical protein